ncbi:MAG: transporter, partial [Ferruginibacter sp.]
EKNLVYPTILWKYGINEKLEFRLISELITNKNSSENLTGINPIKVGFKAKLIEEKGIVPTTSFIGHLTIPFLSTVNFRTTYFAPSFRFTMQHSLTDKISLGYNLGAEWNGEIANPTFIYTLTSGKSFTDKVGGYIELYGFVPQKEKSEHRCDGGITYFLKPNIMFDISGGVGLTKNAPKYYSSLGFSIRIPN